MTLSLMYICFIAVVFGLYWLTKGKLRLVVLLLANIAFLMCYMQPIHILYCLVVIIYTFLIGRICAKKKINILLVIIPYVIFLVFFKYFGLFGFTNIIMPIGISFYTFKAISYVVDIKRKKVNSQGLLNIALYISFFPTIVAGPINRCEAFFQDLKSKKPFNYQYQKNGFARFMLGAFEKIVISDYIAIIVTKIFDNNTLTGWYLILGVALYSLQIYTDFDSYSNMAIGISKMLGFEIEENFKQPYLSKSIKEFWGRWHVSLSSWFKDYVYIPLGGNRKGIFLKYVFIIIVFGLSGMWHGATINFMIWGLGFAVIYIIEDLVKKIGFTKHIPSFIKIIFNFIVVSLLWIFFRNTNFDDALFIFKNLFNMQGFNYELIGINIRELIWLSIVLVIVIITDLIRYHTNFTIGLSKRNVILRWSFYTILILLFIVFGIYGPGYNPQDFIYALF